MLDAQLIHDPHRVSFRGRLDQAVERELLDHRVFHGIQAQPGVGLGQHVESRVAEVTKNARAVWQQLEQPRTRIELADRLGMTLRQVHFTLDKLRDARFVDMVGAGHSSAYRRRRE